MITPTVLLVEDSLFIQELLSKNIRHLEMQVAGVCSGVEDALKAYASLSPQAVLVDYGLPGELGNEVCEHLLAHDIYARIIVLLPARKVHLQQQLIGMGIKAVLAKPFYPDILQRTLIEVVMGF